MTQSSSVDWNWLQFQQLSTNQLYDLLRLRLDVFIFEQQCIYHDIDDLDPDCFHLLGYDGKQLIAYLRLIPAEFHDSGNIALGRIISLAVRRGSGIGKSMMELAIQYAIEHFPDQDIQLAAQYYLLSFYEKFGFNSIGEPYDDDGIMHIDMIYQPMTDS